jgi:hypothetical protein
MAPDLSLVDRAGRALGASAGDAVIVRSPVAPLHAEARVSSMQTSQALAGHALAVDGREGDWLRVRGADDYAGWMHAGYVVDAERALGGAGAGWYRQAEISLDCTVRGPFGRRALPLGAVLLPGERCETGDAVGTDACVGHFARTPEAVVETALRAFEGTSYQWGGVTPWGADCSGLVQSAFTLHGVPLPRDAWQQALEGEGAGDDPLALAAGDLLFFSDRADGRITHVGIAVGDGRMVHLALGRGGYAVDRLDDPADAYVAMLRRNFRLARRVAIA